MKNKTFLLKFQGKVRKTSKTKNSNSKRPKSPLLLFDPCFYALHTLSPCFFLINLAPYTCFNFQKNLRKQVAKITLIVRKPVLSCSLLFQFVMSFTPSELHVFSGPLQSIMKAHIQPKSSGHQLLSLKLSARLCS